jgi:hypothetical protein
MRYTVIGSTFYERDTKDLKQFIRDENFHTDSVCLMAFFLAKHQVVVTTNTLCEQGTHELTAFSEPTCHERGLIRECSKQPTLKLIQFETDEPSFVG